MLSGHSTMIALERESVPATRPKALTKSPREPAPSGAGATVASTRRPSGRPICCQCSVAM
jgi:hypothetical protein